MTVKERERDREGERFINSDICKYLFAGAICPPPRLNRAKNRENKLYWSALARAPKQMKMIHDPGSNNIEIFQPCIIYYSRQGGFNSLVMKTYIGW